MTHIAMLLSNPFRPDPRVLKEAEGLAAQGFEITVIAWDRTIEYPHEETITSGVHILRVQNVPSTYGIGAGQLKKLPAFWKEAAGRLETLHPDFVHCHDFDTLPAGLWWAKRHKVPVIYDAHEYYAELTRPRLHGISGSLLYHLIRLSENTGARLADAVVTVDETLASRYRRLNKRVLVVGHYPPRSMAEDPAPVFSRPELTLLYQGRISTDRGMLIYVDALRMLRERGIPARLVLAGVITPAAEETSLRKAIEGVEEFVDLPGWVPFYEMGSLLHSADIGLAVLLPEPRYVAALPVKLFEYMAAGLPVIASRFPLIEEVVTTSFCGTLVDPRDGAGPLADIVEEWWHHPQDALSAGARGREAVLEHYNWETLVERLVDLYRSLDTRSHSIPTPPSVQ